MLQWLTAREDYHRLLAQIVLSGTRNGSAVTHYYEYVNFRAETQAAAVFDACALAPKVSWICMSSLLCMALSVQVATEGGFHLWQSHGVLGVECSEFVSVQKFCTLKPQMYIVNIARCFGRSETKLCSQGENCNCTSADLAALASGQQQLLAASLDGVTIDPAAVECLGAATSSQKGFSHAQAGPYALFTLVGFAIGVILAIAASFVWTTLHDRGQGRQPSPNSLGGNSGKFQSFDADVARG